jgi:flagellar biosynthesis GTPase FlhF
LADWEGNHAFLGEHAADRLDLVLHLARLLTEAGRRVLVVSVLPDPDRDEPRLKNLAAAAGHDAAVVRDVGQLQDMESHLTGYDLVLLDLPGLMHQKLAEGGPVHRWLASNEKFHRHLLIPMDRDFLDLDDLREAVRSWNCDWLALTRLDGTRRAAKLLDLIDSIPLPVSFMAENAVGEGLLDSATPELLLDRILAADTSARFRPGAE